MRTWNVTLFQFLVSVCIFDDQDPLGLIVAGSGRNTPGF